MTAVKRRLALSQRSLFVISSLSWVWTHCLLLWYVCLEGVSCILSSHLLSSVYIIFIISWLLPTSKLFWLGKSGTIARTIIVCLRLCHCGIVYLWVYHSSKSIVHMTSRLRSTSWLLRCLLSWLWSSLNIESIFCALCGYLIV